MIQFKSVWLTHEDKIIFNNLNLQIQKNEKILLLGKSGIGKTSLLRMLLGFEYPDKGTVGVNQLDISKTTIKTIRSQIFYLSQDIDLKNETVSVLLKEICEINHIEPDEGCLTNLLQVLELRQTILKQKTNKLSGGERQRIGLLIGFLLHRPIWLLDEPTSALDNHMKQKVADHILALDKTMIIVSHDAAWQNHPSIKIERWT